MKVSRNFCPGVLLGVSLAFLFSCGKAPPTSRDAKMNAIVGRSHDGKTVYVFTTAASADKKLLLKRFRCDGATPADALAKASSPDFALTCVKDHGVYSDQYADVTVKDIVTALTIGLENVKKRYNADLTQLHTALANTTRTKGQLAEERLRLNQVTNKTTLASKRLEDLREALKFLQDSANADLWPADVEARRAALTLEIEGELRALFDSSEAARTNRVQVIERELGNIETALKDITSQTELRTKWLGMLSEYQSASPDAISAKILRLLSAPIVYDAEAEKQWSILERTVAVFLDHAFTRNWTHVFNVQVYCARIQAFAEHNPEPYDGGRRVVQNVVYHYTSEAYLLTTSHDGTGVSQNVLRHFIDVARTSEINLLSTMKTSAPVEIVVPDTYIIDEFGRRAKTEKVQIHYGMETDCKGNVTYAAGYPARHPTGQQYALSFEPHITAALARSAQ